MIVSGHVDLVTAHAHATAKSLTHRFPSRQRSHTVARFLCGVARRRSLRGAVPTRHPGALLHEPSYAQLAEQPPFTAFARTRFPRRLHGLWNGSARSR